MQVSFFVIDPPEHVNPVSIVQVELQPSPLIVLPSSQPTNDFLLPSPHVSVQIEGEV